MAERPVVSSLASAEQAATGSVPSAAGAAHVPGEPRIARDSPATPAEQAARDGERFVRAVLDSLFVFVGVLAPDGTLVEANRAPLEVAGLQLADVQGRPFWTCPWWAHDEAVGERVRDAVRRAAAGETVRFDVPIRIAGGRLMWIDFQLAPLRDPQGRITHLIPSGMDLTDRRESQRALQEAAVRADIAQEVARAALYEYVPATGVVTRGAPFTSITGHAAGTMPGTAQGWFETIDPRDRDRVVQALRDAMAQGDAVELEYRVRHRDGHALWISDCARIVRDGDGGALRMIGMIVDITGRKRAEAERERLLESERTARDRAEQLRELATALSAARTRHDVARATLDAGARAVGSAKGVLYVLGDAAASDDAGVLELVCALGFDEDDLDPWRRVPLGEHNPASVAAATRTPVLVGTRASIAARFPGLHPLLQRTRWEAAAAFPLVAGDDAPVLGAVCFDFEDARHFDDADVRYLGALAMLTGQALERARLFEAEQAARAGLAASAAALREADARKNEFLAILSHELRNPLAPLRNALRIVEHESLGLRGRDALRIATRQTARLARLVDDLLEVSRITRGKIDLRIEAVDLRDVVAVVAETLGPALHENGQRLELDLPAAPVRVDGDPLRLSQVVENLLSNASKYSDAGGHVRIALRAADGEARLGVSDDGIGIAADDLGRVFELFAQVDASLDRARGGLGIGLALVRQLVQMHGGRIDVASAGAGLGSTFTVVLPLRGEG